MNELEQFKKDYKQRIAAVADKKTHWLKDFIESQKPKPKDKTVDEAYKEQLKNIKS